MALQVKVSSFNTTTGAAGGTVSITDCGFQPLAVIFWWTKSTTTGATDVVAGSHLSTGAGFAVSSTARSANGMQSEDASAASDTDRWHDNTQCVEVRTITGAVDGSLDFSVFTVNGFDLVIDDAFTASYHIHYIAFGGSDLANAFTSSFSFPIVTGNFDVTAPGFQPDVVFLAYPRNTTAPPAVSTNAAWSFGFAVSSTQQATVGVSSVHAQATMETGSYGTSRECVVGMTTSAPINTVSAEAEFVQFLSNGFRLNITDAEGTTANCYYLCLKGGQWAAGEGLTKTNTTDDIVVSGLAFQPVGGMVISHVEAESAANTPTAHNRVSIGAFDSATSRGCQGHLDQDAVADSICTLIVEHDAVYASITTGEAIDALMDVKSVDSGGATFIMDDADSQANWFGWLMCGSAAAAATSLAPPRRRIPAGQAAHLGGAR